MNKLVQINKIKHLLDTETYLLTINGFVFSRLVYCLSVWKNTSTTNIHKLQIVQKFVARIILGLCKCYHTAVSLKV